MAPNVKIAGIKAGNADGFFFPEAVICAFMWAGTHGIDVTNNSYFADPWLFNCKNDPEQRAIWKAEQRAIKFAQGRASRSSPPPATRPTTWRTRRRTPRARTTRRRSRVTITNACAVVPAEVPGVVSA